MSDTQGTLGDASGNGKWCVRLVTITSKWADVWDTLGIHEPHVWGHGMVLLHNIYKELFRGLKIVTHLSLVVHPFYGSSYKYLEAIVRFQFFAKLLLVSIIFACLGISYLFNNDYKYMTLCASIEFFFLFALPCWCPCLFRIGLSHVCVRAVPHLCSWTFRVIQMKLLFISKDLSCRLRKLQLPKFTS